MMRAQVEIVDGSGLSGDEELWLSVLSGALPDVAHATLFDENDAVAAEWRDGVLWINNNTPNGIPIELPPE